MHQLEGTNVTFEGNTYRVVEVENIYTDSDELWIIAEDPFGDRVTLVYNCERSLPDELPNTYKVGPTEVTTANSAKELVVRPSSLDKGYIFTLTEVNEST